MESKLNKNNFVNKARSVCSKIYLFCLGVAIAGNITTYISSNNVAKLTTKQQDLLDDLTSNSEQFAEMKLTAYNNYKTLFETDGYHSVGTPQDYMRYLNSDNYKEKVIEKLTDVDITEYKQTKENLNNTEKLENATRTVYQTLTATTIVAGAALSASKVIEREEEKEL